MNKSAHPYHYSEEKNIIQQLIDFGVPILLFWVYFQFVGDGQVTPRALVKTTGLASIALLSITLAIGPLCRFLPFLNNLKAHRKVWGIFSFIFAFSHISLIFVNFYKFNLLKFVDFQSPRYLAVLTGLIAGVILFVVTATSNKKALTLLSPQVWKMVQTTAYLALASAVAHFYLVGSEDSQLTFGFAGLTVLIRLFVLILPNKK